MPVRPGVALRVIEADSADSVQPPAQRHGEADGCRHEHVDGVDAGLRPSAPDHISALIRPWVDPLPRDRLLVGATIW